MKAAGSSQPVFSSISAGILESENQIANVRFRDDADLDFGALILRLFLSNAEKQFELRTI